MKVKCLLALLIVDTKAKVLLVAGQLLLSTTTLTQIKVRALTRRLFELLALQSAEQPTSADGESDSSGPGNTPNR